MHATEATALVVKRSAHSEKTSVIGIHGKGSSIKLRLVDMRQDRRAKDGWFGMRLAVSRAVIGVE